MELDRRVLVVLGALLAPVLSGAGAGGTGADTGGGTWSGGSGSGHTGADTGRDTGARHSGGTGFKGPLGCGCAHGRPLTGAAVPAGTTSRSDWLDRTVRPDLAGLDDEARRWLASVWASVAVNEHASVSSFHRAALELGRSGGPDRLVAALERAAGDERRHARRAFALASAFAGRPLGPLAADGAVPVAHTLAEVAARTVLEGCGEEARSLAAAVAQREVARDPATVAVLDGVVRDEARHVRLAFRIVRWAARAGGPEVAAAVRRAAAEPLPRLLGAASAPDRLRRWGVLGDDVLARVADLAEVQLLALARRALAA